MRVVDATIMPSGNKYHVSTMMTGEKAADKIKENHYKLKKIIKTE